MAMFAFFEKKMRDFEKIAAIGNKESYGEEQKRNKYEEGNERKARERKRG